MVFHFTFSLVLGFHIFLQNSAPLRVPTPGSWWLSLLPKFLTNFAFTGDNLIGCFRPTKKSSAIMSFWSHEVYFDLNSWNKIESKSSQKRTLEANLLTSVQGLIKLGRRSAEPKLWMAEASIRPNPRIAASFVH